MLTIGVDLSAQPAKTVAAVISWDQSGATVTGLHPGATDASIVDLARTASKVGVDCPLGWPRDFVDFVARHQRGEIQAGEGEDIAAREQLAYRRTDLAVCPACTGLTEVSEGGLETPGPPTRSPANTGGTPFGLVYRGIFGHRGTLREQPGDTG